MALLLVWRHEGNIKKLLNGTESRLGQKSALPAGSSKKHPHGPAAASAAGHSHKHPKKKGSSQ